MNEEQFKGREPDPQPPPGAFSQDFRHTAVSARVPEKIARGVFCTATMILQTQDEFVIDFLSTMTPQQLVVARVVMTASTFGQFVAAVYTNIAAYEQTFGRLIPRQAAFPPPAQAGTGPTGEAASAPNPGSLGGAAATGGPQARPPAPPGPPGPLPTIDDVYDQLKLPDEMAAGTFANVVMIRHTPEEFCFDFIANFYPRSVVTARVYMAAGRVLAFLEAISGSLQQFRHRAGGQPPQGPAVTPPG